MCPRSNAEPRQASDAEVERWGLLLVGATHFARLCLADGSLLQSAMDERNPAGALPNSQDQRVAARPSHLQKGRLTEAAQRL